MASSRWKQVALDHRNLREHVNQIRYDRDRYKLMFDILHEQMVMPVGSEKSRRWRIIVGDGVFYEFDELTQEEADALWRDAWGLNGI